MSHERDDKEQHNYIEPTKKKLANVAKLVGKKLISRVYTPHYVNLNILKFPEIVKLHTCLFCYDLLCKAEPSNVMISHLSVRTT